MKITKQFTLSDDDLGLSVPQFHNAESLCDQAYAILKKTISETDIYGGPDEVQLDEKALTLALGVSRTPIREAITRLEQEGFLRTVPRKGIYIVRKTKMEIVEMVQVWAVLEGLSARLACVHARDEEIAGLRRLFDCLRNDTPAEHMDEYSDANIAFHQAIVNLGGSKLISDTITNILIHVRSIRKLTIIQSDRAARSINDHMRIIEAMEKRDAELVEQLVRKHSFDLADFVLKNCHSLA